MGEGRGLGRGLRRLGRGCGGRDYVEVEEGSTDRYCGDEEKFYRVVIGGRDDSMRSAYLYWCLLLTIVESGSSKS